MLLTPSQLQARAMAVKMLLLDVDGVLTDGSIIYTGQGEEIKRFDIKDGFGLRLAKRAGLKTAIITARHSKVVLLRAQELEFDDVYQNATVKLEALNQLLTRHNLEPQQLAYVGDDLIDLPILRRVGLAVAVPEAPDEVKAEVGYICRKPGGMGAVREVVELILKAQGTWEQTTARYFE